MLTEPALHSIDSGNHTCRVTDAFGNSGTATIEITVTGKLVTRVTVNTTVKPVYNSGRTHLWTQIIGCPKRVDTVLTGQQPIVWVPRVTTT